MQYHAAILNGPNGPFAVLRATPDAGDPPVTDDDRRRIARCFKERHDNIPVAFLANEPSGLRFIGHEDVSDDLAECLRTQLSPQTPWGLVTADV